MAGKPRMHVVFSLGGHKVARDAELPLKLIDEVKPHAVILEAAMLTSRQARASDTDIRLAQQQALKLKGRAKRRFIAGEVARMDGFSKRLLGKVLEENIPVFYSERHDEAMARDLVHATDLSEAYYRGGFGAFLEGRYEQAARMLKTYAKADRTITQVREANTMKTLESVRHELARRHAAPAGEGLRVVAVMGGFHTRLFISLKRRPVEGITTERFFAAQPKFFADRTHWFADNLDALPKHSFFVRPAFDVLLGSMLRKTRNREKAFAVAGLVTSRLKPEHYKQLSDFAAGGKTTKEKLQRFYSKLEELTGARIPRNAREITAFLKRRLPRATFKPGKG